MVETSRPLSPLAIRFCEEYLEDLDGAAAARRAGYAVGRAKQTACSLLKKPAVQALIAAGKAARSQRTQVTADRVLEELALVAFSNIDHYEVDAETGRVTLAEGAPRAAKRAISSVKYRVITTKAGVTTRETELRLWSKDTAIGNAMKHLGLLRDKLEVTGRDGGPLQFEDVTPEQRRQRLINILRSAASRVPAGMN